MAELDTMQNLSWSVVCQGERTYWWRYDFKGDGKKAKGSVSWKDEHNGKGGNGSWSIENGKSGKKLITRWTGSDTVETWDWPIDTKTWAGKCTMGKKPHTLSAKARNYIETDTVTVFSRTPETKARFLELVKQARGEVQISQAFMEIWMSGIATAYGEAYASHNAMLKDISATEKLGQDLLLGFALAFVGGAAGGALGQAVKSAMGDAAKQNEWIIDGVKDIAKYSIRSVKADMLKSKAKAQAPTDPFLWDKSIREIVYTEFAIILGFLRDWEENVYNDRPILGDNGEILPDFDPLQEIKNDLQMTVDGDPIALTSLPKINKDGLRQDYELGFLVGWVKTCGRNVTSIPFARDSIIKTLYDNAVRLGLDNAEAFLNRYIPGTNWSAFTPPAGM
ncbi:hypothetical protein [Bosea sp. (in: a-proteobacteria)]|jgi:hypothetical protein|uniref:hypothetical protein n=1 Tax=Bosea sp. (in: a-proteobacteria) TaxID=1871050 RepID=UPI003565CF6D